MPITSVYPLLLYFQGAKVQVREVSPGVYHSKRMAYEATLQDGLLVATAQGPRPPLSRAARRRRQPVKPDTQPGGTPKASVKMSFHLATDVADVLQALPKGTRTAYVEAAIRGYKAKSSPPLKRRLPE